jgi:Tfp pilus assembly protein PilX
MKRNDDGAALVLVLVVVTVVAVVLGALLSFADTSVRTTVNLRDQAASAYESDGALQTAVNDIRNSTFSGATGQHCFGGSDTLSLPNFNGTDSAAVTCSADPSKVLIQCPSLSQCNRPGSAILTLGTGGEDGLNIQQPTGSTFRVHGTVFSNSNINVVNGALNTNTAVYARGACAGTIQSTPAPKCAYGGTPNPLGNDPGYAPALTTVPVHRSLPPCTTPNSVVTFQPGYYDDAVGLSAMMAGNSACKHSTWWFTPGAYYFDFHNGGTNPNPLLGSGGDLWTINDGYLVAGTPVDTSGRVVSVPSVPANIPGSCDNPIEDAHAVGVQFAFGGDSQLAVKSGQAEICGTYSASAPPVAVYGLTSGAETTTPLTLTASTVTPGKFSGATPVMLASVDGVAAAWTNSAGGPQSGTLATGGYAPSPALPVGSILKTAQLRVVHRNDQGSTKDTLSVDLTPSGGTTTTVPVPAYDGNGVHDDLIDVKNLLAQRVYDGTFTGAQLNYTAAVKHTGTEQLDALQLVLTYVAPALRAQNGCVTNAPYGPVGTCAMVMSVNNSGNQFYIQGTTYAPKGALDVTLNNAAEQIFRFGVVARSLWVKETGSFSYTGVVIEVPDDSPGFVFGVYLTAYVCPGSGTCAPGGAPVARARVAYVDGDPTNPVAGARQVSVLSWSGSR